MNKRCSRCREYKPKDSFTKDRSRKDGLAHCCRNCLSIIRRENHEKEYEKTKRYRAAHPEWSREQHRKWYYKHRKHALQYKKEYDKNHPGAQKAYCRKRYAEDEEYREKCKKRSLLNKQKFEDYYKEYGKRYYREHPEKSAEHRRKRRAAKFNAEGSYTFKEWIELCEREGWLCALCGAQLNAIIATADHIIPLVRGGSDYISNIQPACRSCNCRKGTKLPEELEVK